MLSIADLRWKYKCMYMINTAMTTNTDNIIIFMFVQKTQRTAEIYHIDNKAERVSVKDGGHGWTVDNDDGSDLNVCIGVRVYLRAATLGRSQQLGEGLDRHRFRNHLLHADDHGFIFFVGFSVFGE